MTDRRPADFFRDETGATLVEFSLVISLFLLIFFGLIDFGRLAYHLVTSERAMQAAARIAAVRPAACRGVPDVITRHASAPASADYGTSCGAAGGPFCANSGIFTCPGAAGGTELWELTDDEVWAQVRNTLPGTATIANLRFTYTYDPRMGFLGGPYVPIVTVQLQNVTFEFVTPLSALAAVAGATPGGTVGSAITLPGMSVSMPGEDLAQGNNG